MVDALFFFFLLLIDGPPSVDVKSAPHAKHTARRTKLA
jgi:hypothetical protein